MQEESLGQPSEPVLACTLTGAEVADRQQAWSEVGKFITAGAEIPGGLAFDFARAGGVQQLLGELVRLEAECCPWMSFQLTDSPERIRLFITGAKPDGERAARESFAALLALGSQGSVTVG